MSHHDVVSYLKLFFHSIRGPLNNAMIGLDIMADQMDNTNPMFDMLFNVKTSCSFVAETLDSFTVIRNLTQSSDTPLIKMAPFNIDGMMRQIQCLIFFDTAHRGRHFNYTPPDTICEWVVGDEHNLKHVILYLLEKCMAGSDPGASIEIKLSATILDGNRQRMVITVTDENKVPAVSDDDPQWLVMTDIVYQHGGDVRHVGGSSFDERRTSFMRSLSMTSRPQVKHHQTYILELPLAVCNQTFVSIKSALTRAAIPVDIRERLVKSREPSFLPAVPTILPPTGPAAVTVGIIDDSDMARKMLLHLVQTTSWDANIEAETLIMCDGLDAVVKLHARLDHISVLFMDNMMPALAGPLTAKLLRALGYKNLIIGITGNSMPDDVAQFYAGGIDFLFVKPLKRPPLQALWRLLRTSGMRSVPGAVLHFDGSAFAWRAPSP
jgi:CheY-like chemotaxis protein